MRAGTPGGEEVEENGVEGLGGEFFVGRGGDGNSHEGDETDHDAVGKHDGDHGCGDAVVQGDARGKGQGDGDGFAEECESGENDDE